MTGSGRCLRYCGMSGQCGNGAVQGVTQVMQGGSLQPQRQRTDIQVDEAATSAVLDVSDQSVGQHAVIAGFMHDHDSVTDRCSVATGDGLPARQQRGSKGLHQPGSSHKTLLRKNAELIGDGMCNERAGLLRVMGHQVERGRRAACGIQCRCCIGCGRRLRRRCAVAHQWSPFVGMWETGWRPGR